MGTKIIRSSSARPPGSEDISGDYNVYTQVKTADVNGTAVTMKGEDSPGQFHKISR